MSDVTIDKDTIDAATKAMAALYDEMCKDDNALVYNATDKKVQFFCYNDSDSTYIIAARKPMANPGYTAFLNKSGTGPTITVRINDRAKMNFNVLRKKCYIWDGKGFVEVTPDVIDKNTTG